MNHIQALAATTALKVMLDEGCVNPDHLFLGTCAQNMADMASKNRADRNKPSGEECGASKLTKEEVIKISLDNRKVRTIASEFGISKSQVSRIRLRKTWKRVWSTNKNESDNTWFGP